MLVLGEERCGLQSWLTSIEDDKVAFNGMLWHQETRPVSGLDRDNAHVSKLVGRHANGDQVAGNVDELGHGRAESFLLKWLEGRVEVENCLEGGHRELDREHDRVDRQTVARHPEDKHHHGQLTHRRLCEVPCFLDTDSAGKLLRGLAGLTFS